MGTPDVQLTVHTNGHQLPMCVIRRLQCFIVLHDLLLLFQHFLENLRTKRITQNMGKKWGKGVLTI